MYIYITKQNKRVFLFYAIDNRLGNYRIALKEIGFKVKWINISEKAKNNWVEVKDEQGDLLKRLKIPDGYYNFCSLREVFSEFGIKLKINEANLIVTMNFPKLEERREYVFPRSLSRILGFYNSGETYSFSAHGLVEWGLYEYLGNRATDFLMNPMLFVHLQQLKTDVNLFEGYPSTVLRALPSITAGFCDYQLYRFDGNSQFKELAEWPINSLDVKITNQDGAPVVCSDLLMVLEVEERTRNP